MVSSTYLSRRTRRSCDSQRALQRLPTSALALRSPRVQGSWLENHRSTMRGAVAALKAWVPSGTRSSVDLRGRGAGSVWRARPPPIARSARLGGGKFAHSHEAIDGRACKTSPLYDPRHRTNPYLPTGSFVKQTGLAAQHHESVCDAAGT